MKICSAKANSKGFTLIELLIVVVILGILAAVVIPQLSGATDDAKTESLKTNLANMRTAIEMYEYEHAKYPGVDTAVGTSCPNSGTAGTGTGGDAATFASQLTMYTDISGKACSTKDSTYKYGPYIKSAEMGLNGIPLNVMTASRSVVVSATGNLSMVSVVVDGGWLYDNISGKIIADHSSYDHL